MGSSATTQHSLAISTAEGEFLARYSAKGLCGLEFPSSARSTRASVVGSEPSRQVKSWHALTAQALDRALHGSPPGSLPPLDFSVGTGFQRSVWRAMRRIAPGQTRSYGQMARAIGRPKAVRAVGGACGANPIPVFIPCHRVLAARQRLGGFSSDINWKRKLLAREGVRFFE